MIVRATASACFVMMPNGLTLELTFDRGGTRGTWLLGERWLGEVVAASA